MDFKKKKTIAQLKRHEGFRPDVYLCTNNYKTIGYGRNLDTNPLTEAEKANLQGNPFNDEPFVNEIEATMLLGNDITRIIISLQANIPFYTKLDGARQAVLINMAFNMGVSGLLKFKNTLAAIERYLFHVAAAEMFDSKWRTEIGQERFTELALQMATGVFFDLSKGD